MTGPTDPTVEQAYDAWQAYLAYETPADGPDQPELELLRQALVALEVAAAGAGAEDGTVRYLLGCARLDQYRTSTDPETALEALDGAVAAFEVACRDDGWTPLAALEVREMTALARWEQYRHRPASDADLAGTEEHLRAALRLATEPVELDPTVADELLPTVRWELTELLGLTLAARWADGREQGRPVTPTELDRLTEAITSLTAAIEHQAADRETALSSRSVLAQLLQSRAAQHSEPAAAQEDLIQATGWHDAAVATIAADDPRRATVLIEAARHRLLRSQIDQDPALLPVADEWLTEAVRTAGDDPQQLPQLLHRSIRLARHHAGQIALPEAEMREAMRSLAAAVAADTSPVPAEQRLLRTQLDQALTRADEQSSGADQSPQAALAAAAVKVLLYQQNLAELDGDTVIGQLTEAIATGPPEPQFQAPAHALLGLAQALQADHDPGLAEAAVTTLRTARDLAVDDDLLTAEVDGLLSGGLIGRYNHTGDASDLGMPRGRGEPGEFDALPPHARRVRRLQQISAAAQQASIQHDLPALDQAIEEMTALVAEMPAGDRFRGRALSNLALARAWRITSPSDELPATDDFDPLLDLVEQAAADPGTSPDEQSAMQVNRSIVELSRAMAAQDFDRGAPAVERLHKLIPDLPPAGLHRTRALVALGSYHAARAEIERDRAAAESAVPLLEEAWRAAGHAGHPFWTQTAMTLAKALRARHDEARGDRARSRETGQEMLRGQVWKVLQADAAGASAAATDAAENALTVAGWCLTDDQPEAAARVIDAGRGLALHAAFSGADLGDQLDQGGHVELAQEWRAEQRRPAASDDGAIPTGLRRRILKALVKQGTLLDPPTVEETAVALRRSSAHALVYLVPAVEGSLLPTALVVPATGPPAILRLPLHLARTDILDQFLRSHEAATLAVDRSRRDAVDSDPAGPVDLPETATARQDLQHLVSWAWTAAMGDVLYYLRRQGWSVPYRLVLVPVGYLGLVPWHAARAPDGRYLLHEAIVSIAPSARLFVRTVTAPSVPISSGCLVVGDPTGDLAFAGQEARAIRDRIYRTDQYLGPDERAVGRGTPAEVLRWLDATSHRPRGVLHLACHGRVVPNRPTDSYLELAGRARLTTEQLTRYAHSGGRWRIGNVVLAACSTGTPGQDYDEALSLSTAFLAAGASSVVGSMWKVPDTATSLLMFMYHHYLVIEGRGPAEALREAQLWMLRPDRTPPPEMPEPLADRAPELAGDDLLGWAGFSHLGHW